MRDVSIQMKRRSYFICPECGNFQISSTNEEPCECSVCGVKMINRCPECHEPIYTPVAKYCTKCGTSLTNENKKNPAD